MGNFEKLSVLVIVVIIVMILVVALYTWTGDPSGPETPAASVATSAVEAPKPPNVGFPTDPRARELPKERIAAPPNTDKPRLKSSEELMRELIQGGVEKDDGAKPVIEEPKPVVVKEPKLHTVASGETIGKISRIYYPASVQRGIDAILKANPTVDPTRMAISSKLLIPDLAIDAKATDGAKPPGGTRPAEPMAATISPGSIYVTRKGDTLPNLAKRAYRDGNQWHRIWVENFDDISDTEHLQAGLRLKIPVL